jgi:phage portal protein BeeE
MALMSIFDTLRKARRTWRTLTEWDNAVAAQKAAAPDAGYFRSSASQSDMPGLAITGNQEGAYAWSTWIYTAGSRVSAVAATTGFQVKRLQNERREAIVNHPFELLLQHPNPVDSRFTLLESLFSFMALTNNGYLWLNRASEKSAIDELFVIPSREIRPHPDGRMAIDGYEYYPDGLGERPVFLPTWQVCHVKRFNPRSRFVGLSPVELAATAALTDRAQANWNYRNYGQQNAKTPGVLAFPDPIPDPLWKLMKEEFYGADGTGSTRQVILMRNTGMGTPKWIPTHLNQSEMQYLESRQFSKEEIFDLFAPGLMAMLAVNATEANSRSNKATLMEMVIWPTMVAAAEAITNTILPTYGPGLVGEFDDVRVTDKAMALQEYAGYAPEQTINENRQRQDLEPLKGDLFAKVPVRVLSLMDAGTVTQLTRKALGIEEPSNPTPPQLRPFTGQAPQGAEPTPPTEAPGEANLSEPTPQEGMQEGAAKALSPEARADLEKWRRKVIKRAKPCEFESEAIPEALKAEIAARMAHDWPSAFDPWLKAAESFKVPYVTLPDVPSDTQPTMADVESAIAEWDRIMPAEYRGLLDATAER